MPAKKIFPRKNVFEATIGENKQRYTTTHPKPMGLYVKKYKGVLKGGFESKNGKITYFISNLKENLHDKLKELEKE
jgi:hypothetical protein